MAASGKVAGSSQQRFEPTRWSIIVAAGDCAAGSRQRQAMEQLARAYWPPLYGYLRRCGNSASEAEDFTQAFFARLIEKQDLQSVHPDKGRFRSFLLAALKHFTANERDKARAQKRGGDVKIVPLDSGDAESRYGIDPADTRTPEQEFNRRWAVTVLETVVSRLREEYRKRDQLPLFDALQGTLTGEISDGYATVAVQLSTTEGALQVAAHRMRKRYRELFRDEIAQTVADPALVDDEMRDLMSCL